MALFDPVVMARVAFEQTFMGFFFAVGVINALYLLRKPLRKMVSYVRS